MNSHESEPASKRRTVANVASNEEKDKDDGDELHRLQAAEYSRLQDEREDARVAVTVQRRLDKEEHGWRAQIVSDYVLRQRKK